MKPDSSHIKQIKVVSNTDPFDKKEKATFTFSRDIARVTLCRMDESEVEDITTTGGTLNYEAAAKKIVTLKIEMKQ